MRSEPHRPRTWPRSCAVALAAVMAPAAPAGAETLVDAYGLGTHAPRPEVWTKIDDTLSVRAQIRDAEGRPVDHARRGAVLRLGLDAFVQPGAADRPLALSCAISFYDAEGRAAPGSDTVPCYAGRLAAGTGRFRPLDLDFRFRNTAGDPAGTAAVVVRVTDTGTGEGITLAPTYRLED